MIYKADVLREPERCMDNMKIVRKNKVKGNAKHGTVG